MNRKSHGTGQKNMRSNRAQQSVQPSFQPNRAAGAKPAPGSAAFKALLVMISAMLMMTLWVVPAAAQDEESALFIDRVDVNIINVEVFVTDEDGNRVSGLTADDFEVLEDGVPVEVTNFYTITRAAEPTSSFERDREMVTGQPSTAGAEPPAGDTIPKDQRLSLAVYVDNYNIRQSSRAQVLKELGRFIEDRVHRGDRVGLLSHGLTVRSVVPFTDDLVTLVQGIEEVSKETVYGQASDAARRRVLRTLEYEVGGRGVGGADADRAADEIRNFVQQRRQEVERSINALEGVIRSVSGLPGRKAVLYVSDGLPQTPGEDLYQYYIDRFGARGGTGGVRFEPISASLSDDQSEMFNSLTRRANAGGVTLYTLHATGAKTRSSVSAENAPGALTNRGDTLSDVVRLDNHQEPLVDMAAATGGVAIVNTSNFGGAFERLTRDFDSLYSLGYPSRRGGDGKYHSIEVRVLRPGLKARHRSGYVDKPEATRVADRTYSSLILDLESNPLGISVDFGTPEKEGRGKFHLPFLVRIPFSGITLLPNGENHEGRLRIHVAVQDEQGGVSELQEIPFPVSVPANQLAATEGKEMGYAGKLLVRNGIPKVALGVWDEVSGLESFVHKSVQVGKAKKNKKKKRRGP